MQVTTKITVDMTRQNVGQRVNAVQGDGNTRSAEITILSGGQPWTPPEGVDVAIAYYQPDGHKGLYNLLADGSAAISISGNVATIILAPQMLTVSGTVQASLVFNDAALNRLTTFPFAVSVTSNPAYGAQKTEDYIRLQWLEDKLDEYLRKAADSGEFDGKPGDNGVTFTPSVSENGDLSWRNNGGLPNPQTVNIRGPQGESAVVDDTLTISGAAADAKKVGDSLSQIKDDLVNIENDITIDFNQKSSENYLVLTETTDGEDIQISVSSEADTVNLRCGNSKNILPTNIEAFELMQHYNMVFKLPQSSYLTVRDKDTTVDMTGIWVGTNADPNVAEFTNQYNWICRPDKTISTPILLPVRHWIAVYRPYGDTTPFQDILDKFLQRYYIQLEFGDVSTDYVEPSVVQTTTWDKATGKLSNDITAVNGSTMVYNADRDTTATISVTTPIKVKEAVSQNATKIGSLDDLNTTAKDNLVVAINEALTKGGGESAFPSIGKKYFAIGDSITHGYNHTYSEQKQYWRQLKNWCGFETVDGNGECGTCIAEGSVARPMSGNSRMSMIPDDADVISVLGGVNDWNNNYTLGNMESTEMTTFYGALKYYVSALVTRYWDKKIFFITPIQCNCNYSPATGQSVGTWTNANGNTLEQFADAVKEVCGHYGVPCLDLYHNCFDGYNEAIKTHYLPDGLHPIPEGHTIIARKVAKFINYKL